MMVSFADAYARISRSVSYNSMTVPLTKTYLIDIAAHTHLTQIYPDMLMGEYYVSILERVRVEGSRLWGMTARSTQVNLKGM